MAAGRNRKSRRGRILFVLVLAVLAVSVALNVNDYLFPFVREQPSAPFTTGEAPGNIDGVGDLSVEGFSKVVNVSIQESLDHDDIYLDSGCRRLVGGVDPVQGQSISNALNGVIDARPNTHNLMKDAFDVLGVKVLMAKVVGLKGNNYIGRLVIQQGSMVASLDSRPSDGVAITLRVNASVYVNSTLLSEKGQNIC